MSGPLSGLRVLDISTVVAAPMSAALLGDFGADVVKVELPAGDGMREFPPFKDGHSLWWKVTNRNKRFVTLDLRKPEGLAMFKQMLPHFDVLIENFRPGTLARWGLPVEELWRLQPRLVILRTTGFGQTGPYSRRPGFARIFEAMGGLAYLTGPAEGEPTHAGYPLGDAIGGMFGAIGVLAALWKRASEREAPGEEIDLSITEAVLRLLEFLPIEYDQLGTVRERSGNRNQYSAPACVLQANDGRWVSLAGSTDALFARNCRAIERLDLIDDPRFAGNADRVKHDAELRTAFAEWIGSHTLAEAQTAFDREDGTLAPIYAIDQIFDDPHFQAREALTSVPDQHFGEVRMQNVVPRFTRDPGSIRASGRSIGYDNEAVYGELLGIGGAALEKLANDGVI